MMMMMMMMENKKELRKYQKSRKCFKVNLNTLYIDKGLVHLIETRSEWK